MVEIKCLPPLATTKHVCLWDGLLSRCDSVISSKNALEVPDAQRLVNALQAKAKDTARDANIMAVLNDLDEVHITRDLELKSLFNAPPVAYLGTMQQWSTGAKTWIQTIGEHLSPRAVAERHEQQFALRSRSHPSLLA